MVLGCEFPLKLTHWCQIPPVLRSTPCAFWASIWTVPLLGASLGGPISRFLHLPAVLFLHWVWKAQTICKVQMSPQLVVFGHISNLSHSCCFCRPRCPILLGCIVDCICVGGIQHEMTRIFKHSSSYHQLLLALPLLIWHLLWVMSNIPTFFWQTPMPQTYISP